MDTDTPNLKALAWGYPTVGNEQHDHLYDQSIATFGCRAIFKMGIMDIVGNRTSRQGDTEALRLIDISKLRAVVEERAKRSYQSYEDLGLIDVDERVKALVTKSYGYLHTTVFILKETK